MTSLWPDRNLVAEFDDQVRAELQRPADVRRGERVVDDVGRAVLVRKVGDRRVVGHDGRRVGDRLGIHDAGRRGGDRGRSGRVVGHVDEIDLHPETREGLDELRPRRAVDGQRRHDPVAGLQLRGKGGMDSAHAGGERDPGLTRRQLGVGRAEGRGRRVGDPRVRVSRARIGGDVAQLPRIGRGERRGLVDRHARCALVDPGCAGCGPDGSRREPAGSGVLVASRIVVVHAADATPGTRRRPRPIAGVCTSLVQIPVIHC